MAHLLVARIGQCVKPACLASALLLLATPTLAQDLFVSILDEGAVHVLNSDGFNVYAVDPLGPGYGPDAIAFDKSGTPFGICVSDGTYRLIRYDPGRVPTVIAADERFMPCLAIDSSNNLFVGMNNMTVLKLNTYGNTLGTFASTAGHPGAIATHPNGNLYVITDKMIMQCFLPSGEQAFPWVRLSGVFGPGNPGCRCRR